MCVFPRCCRQRRLFFRVVDHSMEKLSALLPTTQKNIRIRLSPQIQNHIRIYTRMSIRGLGWCVSWRKVEVKISWDCPFKKCLRTKSFWIFITLFKAASACTTSFELWSLSTYWWTQSILWFSKELCTNTSEKSINLSSRRGEALGLVSSKEFCKFKRSYCWAANNFLKRLLGKTCHGRRWYQVINLTYAVVTRVSFETSFV